MENRFSGLLSRKFLLAVVILIAGVVFLLIEKIDYDTFLNLAKWIMGFYVAGNVGTGVAYNVLGAVKK